MIGAGTLHQHVFGGAAAVDGVEFLQEPIEMSFGKWSLFTDGQGNRFALQPTGH